MQPIPAAGPSNPLTPAHIQPQHAQAMPDMPLGPLPPMLVPAMPGAGIGPRPHPSPPPLAAPPHVALPSDAGSYLHATSLQAAPPPQVTLPHQVPPQHVPYPEFALPHQVAPPHQDAPPYQAAHPHQAASPHQAGPPHQVSHPHQSAPPHQAVSSLRPDPQPHASSPSEFIPRPENALPAFPRRGTFDLTSHNSIDDVPRIPPMPSIPPPRKSRPRPRPSRPKQTPESSSSSENPAASGLTAASAVPSTLAQDPPTPAAAGPFPSSVLGSPTQQPPLTSGVGATLTPIPDLDLSGVKTAKSRGVDTSEPQSVRRIGRKRPVAVDLEEDEYQPGLPPGAPRPEDTISSEDAEAIRRALASERPRRATRRQTAPSPPRDEVLETEDEQVSPARATRKKRKAPAPSLRTRRPTKIAISDEEDDEPAVPQHTHESDRIPASDEEDEGSDFLSPPPTKATVAKGRKKVTSKKPVTKNGKSNDSPAKTRAAKNKGKAAAPPPDPVLSDNEELTPPPGTDEGKANDEQEASPPEEDTTVVPLTPAARRDTGEPSSGAEAPPTSGDVSFDTSHGNLSTVSSGSVSRKGRKSFYGKPLTAVISPGTAPRAGLARRVRIPSLHPVSTRKPARAPLAPIDLTATKPGKKGGSSLGEHRVYSDCDTEEEEERLAEERRKQFEEVDEGYL